MYNKICQQNNNPNQKECKLVDDKKLTCSKINKKKLTSFNDYDESSLV